MPADAVLRVAEQIVSVLSTGQVSQARNTGYSAVQLNNRPGSTPEGSWPFVKLMDFPLRDSIRAESFGGTDSSRGELDKPNGGDEHAESFSVAPQFASPEQLQHQTIDFSDQKFYSLGATMYFLLDGRRAFARNAPPVRGAFGFPKSLRNFDRKMLAFTIPIKRPKDPVALAEMIRDCLLKLNAGRSSHVDWKFPLATVTRSKSTRTLTAARAKCYVEYLFRRHCSSGGSSLHFCYLPI